MNIGKINSIKMDFGKT